MKRHPGLVPLSHDHHHGLVQARRLRRAAEAADGAARVAAGRRFLDFFAVEGDRHFLAEERGAFDLLARHAGADEALLVRALEDHTDLRAFAARLRGELARGAAPASLLRVIGSRLERHIRLEERELFPLLERLATDEEIAALRH